LTSVIWECKNVVLILKKKIIAFYSSKATIF